MKTKVRRHFLKVILLVLVLPLGLSACGDLTNLAQTNLYATDYANNTKVPDTPPQGYGQALLDVPHADGDLKVHLWYYPHPQGAGKPTLIHLHGNAQNLGGLHEANFLKSIESMGFNYMVVDYPGYGKSTGIPNQSRVLASVEKAMDWTKAHFSSPKTVVWGYSLGAGVAGQIVLRNQSELNGFILSAPWTSVRALAKEKFGSLADQLPDEWYQANEYDTLAAAPQIQIPGMIHHGTKDQTIPFGMGELLGQTFLPGLVDFVPLADKDHNDIFVESQTWQQMRDFILGL